MVGAEKYGQSCSAGPVYQRNAIRNPCAVAAGLATMKGLTPEVYDFLDAQGAKLEAGINRSTSRVWSVGHCSKIGIDADAFLQRRYALPETLKTLGRDHEKFKHSFKVSRTWGLPACFWIRIVVFLVPA